jgi:alpha-tubulin suppressor-like RCC1 family protein
MRQVVIAVAAAENHSLCVAASGFVYAWGSNRFGQLGGTTSTESSSARCLPRRVDDLKHVVCVSVAAGTKHSVALSQHGEVYVWGDNGAGQLGFSGRSSSNSNNSLHKVQRVEALWKAANGPKKAIAIAASERSTLILTLGSGQRSLPVNSIYSWGHGSHVPCKVQFDTAKSSRPINPVAIACARYHNAAITSDGHVFTWGLHADSLGTSSRNNRNRSNSGSNSFAVKASLTAPQLVTGMLPWNGGGVAIAVTASDTILL